MSRNRIAYQMELLEQLKDFLTTLQERLADTQTRYDNTLSKMEGQGMFLEKIEDLRNEYFVATKQGIDDIIELIEQSDKPYIDQIIDRLTNILHHGRR